jgi:hypothetical protein
MTVPFVFFNRRKQGYEQSKEAATFPPYRPREINVGRGVGGLRGPVAPCTPPVTAGF